GFRFALAVVRLGDVGYFHPRALPAYLNVGPPETGEDHRKPTEEHAVPEPRVWVRIEHVRRNEQDAVDRDNFQQSENCKSDAEEDANENHRPDDQGTGGFKSHSSTHCVQHSVYLDTRQVRSACERAVTSAQTRSRAASHRSRLPSRSCRAADSASFPARRSDSR